MNWASEILHMTLFIMSYRVEFQDKTISSQVEIYNVTTNSLTLHFLPMYVLYFKDTFMPSLLN